MLVNDIDMPARLQGEQSKIELLIAKGWRREDAIAFQLLFPLRAELSADLERDGVRGVRFPACNYAVAEALFHTAANHNSGSHQQAPRRLYKHLTGHNSLTQADRAWGGLKVPDRTGFRGLTSTALCVATDDPRSFTPHGFRNKTANADGDGVSYDLVSSGGSDVVCFESADNEEELMHSCVMIDEHHGALPANTLFRLKRVEEAGTWAVAGVGVAAAAPSPTAASKLKSVRKGSTRMAEEILLESSTTEACLSRMTVYPNCRLFVVSCTFKRPTEVGDGGGDASGAKLCGSVKTLLYASRETYVNGLDDILEDPPLTMEQEFTRPRPPFVDWRGVTHQLSGLWAYATGTARAAADDGTGIGARDAGNDGMTPMDFLARANAHVKHRRAEFVSKRAGRSYSTDSTDGFDPALLLLNEVDALLTLDEVLAVRLYSGPAFQPINAFLREVGKLSGEYRLAMARHPELTFAATTRHLCRAIRKLADVTRDTADANAKLYRAVRGELPPSFWDKDSLGMISAVDSGFMSTSKNLHTPIAYMRDEFNVLWELEAGEPSDDAYHRGGDISMLSQYAHEDEVLFPPNTLLIVKPATIEQVNGNGLAAAPAVPKDRANASPLAVPGLQRQRSMVRAALSQDQADETSGKAWKLIHVRPCFV